MFCFYLNKTMGILRNGSKLLRFHKCSIINSCSQRNLSCFPTNHQRSVYISESQDVLTNLAFEDWLYRNENFDNKNLLLLWCNKPCVVIGRHQNPWMEANLNYLVRNKITLVRRNSGGGTVYHDLGNLNCTFFTSREAYNRKRNLELICRVLRSNWDVDVRVSPREDIVLNKSLKISGTASKLANKTAYHHCTLLVNVDSSRLDQTLQAPNVSISTSFSCNSDQCY